MSFAKSLLVASKVHNRHIDDSMGFRDGARLAVRWMSFFDRSLAAVIDIPKFPDRGRLQYRAVGWRSGYHYRHKVHPQGSAKRADCGEKKRAELGRPQKWDTHQVAKKKAFAS